MWSLCIYIYIETCYANWKFLLPLLFHKLSSIPKKIKIFQIVCHISKMFFLHIFWCFYVKFIKQFHFSSVIKIKYLMHVCINIYRYIYLHVCMFISYLCYWFLAFVFCIFISSVCLFLVVNSVSTASSAILLYPSGGRPQWFIFQALHYIHQLFESC